LNANLRRGRSSRAASAWSWNQLRGGGAAGADGRGEKAGAAGIRGARASARPHAGPGL